ncbi:MAG: cupin domain-containing protein [Acidobacteriota bacterium]|nr:cupin domain-containing protein [Acidobacteriota bacterium]
MENSFCEVVSLSRESATAVGYENHSVAAVNDHEVRISVMTEAYFWHCHPDSDESFLALEGGLLLDFDDRTVELLPGHMITVKRGVRHRTRPMGERSVNLTFERAGARSERIAAPREGLLAEG